MHRRPLPGSRGPNWMCYVSFRDINFWTNRIKREQRLSRSVELNSAVVDFLVGWFVYLFGCLVGIVYFNGCFVLFCFVLFLFDCSSSCLFCMFLVWAVSSWCVRLRTWTSSVFLKQVDEFFFFNYISSYILPLTFYGLFKCQLLYTFRWQHPHAHTIASFFLISLIHFSISW